MNSLLCMYVGDDESLPCGTQHISLLSTRVQHEYQKAYLPLEQRLQGLEVVTGEKRGIYVYSAYTVQCIVLNYGNSITLW